MNKIIKTNIRDIIFNPNLYAEYPYRYEHNKGNGVVVFEFSKKLVVNPSIIEQHKIMLIKKGM